MNAIRNLVFPFVVLLCGCAWHRQPREVGHFGGTQLESRSYGYDAFLRASAMTDTRNRTTTYALNGGDLVTNVLTAFPGNGLPQQSRAILYDLHGNVINTLEADRTLDDQHLYPQGTNCYGRADLDTSTVVSERLYEKHPEGDLTKRRPISEKNPRQDEHLRAGDKL